MMEKVYLLYKQKPQKKYLFIYLKFFRDLAKQKDFSNSSKSQHYLELLLSQINDPKQLTLVLTDFFISKSLKIKLLGLKWIQKQNAQTLHSNLPSVENLLLKFLDTPNDQVKRLALMTIESLLKREIHFSQNFLQKGLSITVVEEKGFLKAYALLFTLYLKNDLRPVVNSMLRSKDAFQIAFLLSHFAQIGHEEIEEKVVQALSDLIYEKDEQLTVLVLKHIPVICSSLKSEDKIKKFINNIKNLMNNKQKQEFNYLIYLNLLILSEVISKDLVLELLLKTVLNFLRNDQELTDGLLLFHFGKFVKALGFPVLRESILPYFRFLLINHS